MLNNFNTKYVVECKEHGSDNWMTLTDTDMINLDARQFSEFYKEQMGDQRSAIKVEKLKAVTHYHFRLQASNNNYKGDSVEIQALTSPT